MMKKILFGWMIIGLFLFAGAGGAQAASLDSDLLPVTVQVQIEKPDYFWGYPFDGQPLSGIRISGLGKTFTIDALSSGEKLGFEVPKNYKFRLYVSFISNGIVTKEIVYSAKDGVDGKNRLFIITLKAPEPQTVMTKVQGLEEVKR